MLSILIAAPEIKKNYGIIVNQVSPKDFKGIKNTTNCTNFLEKLFCNIPIDNRIDNDNVLFIRWNDEVEAEMMEVEADAYLQFFDPEKFQTYRQFRPYLGNPNSDGCNVKLMDFVNQLHEAEITEGNVYDLKPDLMDEMRALFAKSQDLQEKLKRKTIQNGEDINEIKKELVQVGEQMEELYTTFGKFHHVL